jgi:hypothetical protein
MSPKIVKKSPKTVAITLNPGDLSGGLQHRRQLQFLLDEDDSFTDGCCSFLTW